MFRNTHSGRSDNFQFIDSLHQFDSPELYLKIAVEFRCIKWIQFAAIQVHGCDNDPIQNRFRWKLSNVIKTVRALLLDKLAILDFRKAN